MGLLCYFPALFALFMAISLIPATLLWALGPCNNLASGLLPLLLPWSHPFTWPEGSLPEATLMISSLTHLAPIPGGSNGLALPSAWLVPKPPLGSRQPGGHGHN